MFTKSDNPGQIVYLSSGFVQQNSKLIKSKGYGIMAYGNNVTYSMEAIDTKDGYNWFRPLNSMISLNSKSSVGKDFLKTILNEYGKPGRELEKLGAKSLQDSEKSQMFTKDFPIDGE
jgi:ABC-type phosphate transport system substrate-binding protein